MRTTFFIILILISLALIGCAGSRTYYVEYDTTDVSGVLDSITLSGTVLGQWKEWSWTLDDGRVDNLGFTSLYDKKGRAKGSIQIRQRSDTFNIKIVDYGKR